MSWKDQFRRLKDDWSNLNSRHNILPGSQQQQQQQPQQPPNSYPAQQQQYDYNRPPPPQPQGTSPHPHPPFQHPGDTVYWQPRFESGQPVTQEWDAKQGNNNGWGNNELENYTSNAENAFHTHNHKLIVRAVANNSSADPAQKYISARLVSRQTLARDRGCLTAVVSSPCALGIWPAFWLLPQEPFTWPYDGEVDIMETWNGDKVNHSCLHWGFFNAEDWNKHITKTTDIREMDQRPVRYDFAWDQPGGQPGQGRMLWWIDGRPVMKAPIPPGTRPMRDFTVLLNVAMGGNVCAGQIPRDGAYDMVVHHLALSGDPENGGWPRFENDWICAPEGKVG